MTNIELVETQNGVQEKLVLQQIQIKFEIQIFSTSNCFRTF